MLSRTADHLYWMARYMQQAGQVASRPAAKPQHGDARQRISGVLGRVECAHAV